MLRAPIALALAAAFLGVAAVAGALVVSGRDAAAAQNVFVNPPGIIEAHNSPTVVVNPHDPRNLVVVNRVDRPGFNAFLHASHDGGQTWVTSPLPLPEGKDRPFAPDAAFAPDGRLYVSYVNLAGRGNRPENLWLARSEDGGQTLAQPLRVAGEHTFQARIAIAPDGRIHLTWVEPSQVALLALPGPVRILAAHSTDRGETFSEPVAVSDPGQRPRVGAPSPVVGRDGALYVLYEDFKDDRRDFQNLEGPPHPGPFALVLTRSTDGGESFAGGIEIESEIVPGERFLVFLPEFPSFAVAGDALYVAWADARNGDRDVFLRRSVDGGATWTDASRVNDNPVGDGTDQYLPRVAVAPDGRVDVLFYDRRGDPTNVLTEAYLATSADGAPPFENTPLSTAAFDSRVGPVTGPEYLPVDFGSRLGLASWDGGSFAAWTDTRLGTEATGRQDIVGSRIRHEGLPLAVFVGGGLAIVAVAGLVVRRSGGPRGDHGG